MRFSAFVAIASLAFVATAPAAAQDASRRPEQQSAGQAAAAFMEAFNALDAARFDAFFADDVTMFFPSGPFPKERVVGKPAVVAAFHAMFDLARQRGATRLRIEPQDLAVQDLGGLAIVTFHLRGNDNIGRRSLLFRRDPAGWRIVHFHASSVAAGEQPAPPRPS